MLCACVSPFSPLPGCTKNFADLKRNYEIAPGTYSRSFLINNANETFLKFVLFYYIEKSFVVVVIYQEEERERNNPTNKRHGGEEREEKEKLRRSQVETVGS